MLKIFCILPRSLNPGGLLIALVWMERSVCSPQNFLDAYFVLCIWLLSPSKLLAPEYSVWISVISFPLGSTIQVIKGRSWLWEEMHYELLPRSLEVAGHKDQVKPASIGSLGYRPGYTRMPVKSKGSQSESGPQNPESGVWETKLKWKKIGIKARVGRRKMSKQFFGTIATMCLNLVGTQCVWQTYLRGKLYIICQVNEWVSICKDASCFNNRQAGWMS